MKPSKEDVARQFGRQSRAYAVSRVHARGSDLAMLIALLDLHPHMTALDVATGAGHTAFALAPRVQTVVAVDLAPEMIEETRAGARERGLTNIEARVMDVEALDFPDESFDVVTCRIAPHHFLDVQQAVQEMARVLRPGGQLGLEDSVAPPVSSLDRFINQVETLRDPTHVRSYTEDEWRSMLEAAGLEIRAAEPHHNTHDVAEWVERSGIGAEAVERVYAAFGAASPAARRHFNLGFNQSRVVSFIDDKVIFRADKKKRA
jgi:ubiquinone/menaquinone biosynthesis C-methylase UbiE